MRASDQIELGEVWDASALIQCGCAARGPVVACDRRLDAGLVSRLARCQACGGETEVVLSAPKPKTQRRAEAPLLISLQEEVRDAR